MGLGIDQEGDVQRQLGHFVIDTETVDPTRNAYIVCSMEGGRLPNGQSFAISFDGVLIMLGNLTYNDEDIPC